MNKIMGKDKKIRLAKYLSQAGIASRRKAEEIIAAGQVSVNGEKIYEVITLIDPSKDQVKYQNSLVEISKPIYLLMNKPVGYVSSHRRQKGQKIVFDLLSEDLQKEKLVIVGRLDKESRGLLMLTNDGDLANRLMHPKKEKEKEYLVEVEPEFRLKDRQKMMRGMLIGKRINKARRVALESKNKVKIVLTEGKKRQIRMMLDELNYTVKDLLRRRIANLRLKNLAEGKYRPLTAMELTKLRKSL